MRYVSSSMKNEWKQYLVPKSKGDEQTKKATKIIFGFLRMSFQSIYFYCVEIQWKAQMKEAQVKRQLTSYFSTFHMIKESAFRKLLQLDESI